MLASHKLMFLESSLLTSALCLLAAVCGLVMGGVIYTVAWRMANGIRPLLGGSRCPECDHPLSFSEAIPLVSWVAQRGVCRYCGNPISLAYPASELLGAGVFASIVLRHGVSLQCFEVLGFACVLMTVSLTSLMDYSVRNSCILIAIAIRVAFLASTAASGVPVGDLLLASVVGAVALGLPLFLAVFLSNAMLARDVAGMGTVKLVAVVGFYLGWQQGLLAIAAAFMLEIVVWLVSPTKLLPVEVEGGPTPEGIDGDEGVVTPRELRATHEEDLCEPMRMIPLAPAIAIACWGILLLGVAPSVWSAPLF